MFHQYSARFRLNWCPRWLSTFQSAPQSGISGKAHWCWWKNPGLSPAHREDRNHRRRSLIWANGNWCLEGGGLRPRPGTSLRSLAHVHLREALGRGAFADRGRGAVCGITKFSTRSQETVLETHSLYFLPPRSKFGFASFSNPGCRSIETHRDRRCCKPEMSPPPQRQLPDFTSLTCRNLTQSSRQYNSNSCLKHYRLQTLFA